MKVYLNENDQHTALETTAVKMFSALAVEGERPLVLTYTCGGVQIIANDGYDNHHLKIENIFLTDWLEKWKSFLPDWIENDTGFKDWTPWEYGEWTD